MKSMNKEEMMVQILSDINLKLDEIRTLLKLSHATSIEKTKENLLKSPLRKQIYNLCDGKYTVSAISTMTGKSISSVSQVISKLQEAGLIIEDRKGKEKYYRRGF